MIRRVACIAIVTLPWLLTGCDSGPKVVPVSGVISQDGKPLANASITFYPASGRPSYGTSDADGKYSLQYTEDKDGAVLGEHKVMVTIGGTMPSAPTGESGRGRGPQGFVPPQEVTIPTPVTIEGATTELDLEVPSS